MLFSASLAVENVSYWIFFSNVPLKRLCMSGFGDFFRHCLIVIWQRVNLDLISRSSIPNFVFESCNISTVPAAGMFNYLRK